MKTNVLDHQFPIRVPWNIKIPPRVVKVLKLWLVDLPFNDVYIIPWPEPPGRFSGMTLIIFLSICNLPTDD